VIGDVLAIGLVLASVPAALWIDRRHYGRHS
jgi:hypothetical protein